MDRIAAVFQKSGHKALVPYITVGYPDVDTTVAAALELERQGADILELGIPFSDPMADGVTIQESSYRALLNGTTTAVCLETARRIRQKSQIPLVFMTYYNPVYAYGSERFCNDSRAAGVDGLIVPDLPPDESRELAAAAAASGLKMIYLLAPTSTAGRIRLVAEKSQGYIYIVSVAGVTGTRDSVPDIADFIRRVREATDKPLCVGFGISTAVQAARVASIADGVIIGSKIIQLMQNDPSLKNLKTFTKEVREAMGS
jgi:tryptophan synthase alpha chain